MKNKILYLLLMVTIALSWSLKAEAIDTDITLNAQSSNISGGNTATWTDGVATFTLTGGSLSWDSSNSCYTLAANTTYTLRWALNDASKYRFDKVSSFKATQQTYRDGGSNDMPITYTTSTGTKVDAKNYSGFGEITLGVGAGLPVDGYVTIKTSAASANNVFVIRHFTYRLKSISISYSVSSKYYVDFDGNDNTAGSMSQQAFVYGEAQNIKDNVFTRSHSVTLDADGGNVSPTVLSADATFAGWSLDADGEVAYSDKQSLDALTAVPGARVTLYAKWNLSSVTLPQPEKSEYKFDGWYDGNTKIGVAGDLYTPDSDVTLKAKWKEQSKQDDVVTWLPDKPTTLQVLSTLDINGFATSESNSEIVYSSNDPDIVSVEGTTLVAHKGGTVIITATTVGNQTYNSGNSAKEFIVIKKEASIVWTQILGVLTDRSEPLPLTATLVDADENPIDDTVDYTSSNETIAYIEGNFLKAGHEYGSSTITASFSGNDIYDAAESVSMDVSITGYSISSVWVNDWTSSPVAGEQFYLYNTTNNKLLKAGYGEESRDAFAEAKDASLWTYTDEPKICAVSNSSHFIANRTNQASTDGTGNVSNYKFNYQGGKFQIQGSANIFGTQYYDLFNNGGIFDGYNNGSHFEWWIISPAQYDFHVVNAPAAVDNYLYADKYAIVVGALRNQLADAVTATSNFAAANAQIASLEQAFDDYIAAVAAIKTFENEYSSKTPDVLTPLADIAAAREALSTASSSAEIASALSHLKAFDTIVVTLQPAANLPLHGGSLALTMEATAASGKALTYTSDDENYLIVTADGSTITPVAEGSAAITLTTSTGEGYYAAMPVQTIEIFVTDALVLSAATKDNYQPSTYGTVTLERQFKTGYNSVALPFDVDDLSVLGADWAAQLSLVTYNAHDGYSLYFKKVTSLVANEPYILHVTTPTVNPVFSNQEVVVCESITREATGGIDRTDVSYRKWQMTSNYVADFDMKGMYGVVNQDGVIKQGAQGATLPPFSAYIANVADDALNTDADQPTTEQFSNQRTKFSVHYLNDDEISQLAEELLSEPLAKSVESRVFDLQGRPARQGYQGILLQRDAQGASRKVLR